MIEKMEAPDKSTITFKLSTPFADLPLQLMDYRLRIIPEGSATASRHQALALARSSW
jgi:peptide/nickel transport system substrate-binding protein